MSTIAIVILEVTVQDTACGHQFAGITVQIATSDRVKICQILENHTMQELEAIAGLAALENRKAAQIDLLVRVARAWMDEPARTWLLELARSAYGLGPSPRKLERSDPVEVELIEVLNLLAFGSASMMTLGRGLVINADTWIAMISSSLSSLEEARRKHGPHRLEATMLEVIEFVKQEFFGRNLNLAERSALRGLYDRQKNLRNAT
jgi:hypothetical protein